MFLKHLGSMLNYDKKIAENCPIAFFAAGHRENLALNFFFPIIFISTK